MDYKDFFNYVLNNQKTCNYQFIVTINGEKVRKRLFVYANSYLCEFVKNSRKKGQILFDVNGWENIEVFNKAEKSDYDKLMNTVRKAHVFLSKSGFWPCFKADMEFLMNTEREVLEKVIEGDYDAYMNFRKENNLNMCGDMFFNLISVGIKTIKYEKYFRKYQMNNVKKSIDLKSDFRFRWRNGYDNSIEIKNDEGVLKGWYSEEYKGCGNGYYYYMIDEKHVLFCEKD